MFGRSWRDGASQPGVVPIIGACEGSPDRTVQAAKVNPMSKAPKSSSPKKPEAASAKAKSAKPRKAAKAQAGKTKPPVEPARDAVAEVAEAEFIAKLAAGKARRGAKTSVAAPVLGDPVLLKRLEEMTDFQLRAYQTSTERISRDARHVKSGAAKATLALIEAEVARRRVSPERAPSPVRAAVASPKPGKK